MKHLSIRIYTCALCVIMLLVTLPAVADSFTVSHHVYQVGASAPVFDATPLYVSPDAEILRIVKQSDYSSDFSYRNPRVTASPKHGIRRTSMIRQKVVNLYFQPDNISIISNSPDGSVAGANGSIAYANGVAPMFLPSNPGDRNPGGQTTPNGQPLSDGMLPLLLCLALFAAYRYYLQRKKSKIAD